MAKKITGYLKLQVPAGAANPSPPIGPALGQRGLNIMEFCKAFNAASQDMEKGAPIPVVLTIYADRSFTFEMKTPPVSHFLKKAAGLPKGGQTPGRALVGRVTKDQVRSIAEQKLKDLNARDVEAAMRMVEGSARSMGLEVVGMSKPGKRNRKIREGIDREQLYPLADAVKMVKERAVAKFDETIEVAINLGVDPRHADQMVRGVANLPNGSGRTARVAVFARGDQAEEAKAAGADIVGAEDLVEQVQKGDDRLRPLHRDARHDAARRPARKDSRPARPDAEPEGRHRDQRRDAGGHATPRAARSSSASRRRASCRPASARRRSPQRR